eukprot:scaffold3939_cov28-Tisochrysis_lutea.AAC.1
MIAGEPARATGSRRGCHSPELHWQTRARAPKSCPPPPVRWRRRAGLAKREVLVGGFYGVETTLEEGSKSSFKEVTILNPSLNRRVGRGPVRASSNCLPVEERERGERESDGAEAGEGSPP